MDLVLDGGVLEGVLPEVSPEGPVVLLLRQGKRLLPYLLVGELLLAYPTRKSRPFPPPR
ncbi:hypothetical protein [Thermus scotoductus]|uniref:hypothetical protein n=1 Tax=Thermus scotoductus TaxID=37636 RepID=UPI001561C7A4|nr:hypothetical protein [Thermus scotoductus]